MLQPLTYTSSDVACLHSKMDDVLKMVTTHLHESEWGDLPEIPEWRDIAAWRIEQLQEQLSVIHLQLMNQ